MTAADSRDVEARLRVALQYTTGDDEADRALRGSLLAGIVGDNQELLNVFVEEAGPEQAEFDVHLDGPGVENNATSAKSFSAFVAGLSEAVKETAKHRAGKGRYSEGLLIEGATPGSVRVVLRAPTPKIDPTQQVDSRTTASSVDSDALRSIAAILSHASDPDVDSPLVAEIADLPKGARKGLRRAIRSSRQAGWTIDGTVRQRRVGLSTVALTPNGATRLELELDSRVDSQKSETMIGTIDGFRRSIGTLYFIPEGRPPISAAVLDNTLAIQVAQLAAQEGATVRAIFNVVESRLPGDPGVSRQSRSLISIRSLELGDQTELSVDTG
ncbi:hypothetical protein AB0O58_21040 [Rhodococcus sp. NPDC080181]|uniref:hypothetical protein n=1 Tax=Rhodococcus sp. NPDC080181 TaxID=3155292 RepID=UPI00344DA0DF